MADDAVGDRAHRVLADAEVEVAASRRQSLERARALDQGLGRGREVGVAPDEMGDPRRHGGEHGPARVACRHGGLRGERREVAVPALGERARLSLPPLPRQIGVGGRPGVEPPLPLAAPARATGPGLPEVGEGRLGEEEHRLDRPAQGLLGRAELVVAEGLPVSLVGCLLVGRSITDDRADGDQRRPLGLRLGTPDRLVDRFHIVPVGNDVGVPAVALEATRHVLGEREARPAGQRDLVVVVQKDEATQAKVPGERDGFRGHAFHEVAVGAQGVGVMVDDHVAGLIEPSGQVPLGDGHPHRVGHALAEGAGRRLDARRQPTLGVARGLRAPLAEALDLREGQIVAGEVQESVEQHRAVAGGEHEAIAVGPGGVSGVVLEEARPEDVRHRRRAHREPGMAGLRLLDGVGGEEADRVDAERVEVLARHAQPSLGSS